MTDVRRDDFTLIHSPSDVTDLYRGNGLPLEKQMLGFETEICLYRQPQGQAPRAATPQECAYLLQDIKQRGHAPQLEMASALEYASPAYEVTQAGRLVREIKQSYEAYVEAAQDIGLQPAPGALLPFVTLESAGENLVDRDRARGLVKGMALFKEPEFLKVTLLCTSTQVSVSYKDSDDLFDLLKTGYALGPAIFGIFSNYPQHIEANYSRAVDYHPRAAFYEAFGKDGGIPHSLLAATDGDDFIRRHVEQVFKTEMLFYYDAKNELVWPERPVRFEELKEKGLNTRSNYDLAESFVYTDFKVCNIRNAEGVAIGKRVEVRGFDAGAPGVLGSVPFIHAVLRDSQSHEQVKALLEDYGFGEGLPDQPARLLAARHAVAHHEGKYLDVPFGVRADGSAGNLKDFCRDLGGILALHAQRNPELSEVLQPVIRICETGLTEAEKQARASFSKPAAPRLQNALKA